MQAADPGAVGSHGRVSTTYLQEVMRFQNANPPPPAESGAVHGRVAQDYLEAVRKFLIECDE
jgi:hypothetical protein